MHCEKCGSADTEVTKCGKCGQKSLIRCHNCGYQVCADKYCEVISIKRKIKVLTYFAMFLILLMVIILPIVVMRAMDEDPVATPRPTPRATAKPTPVATPPPVTTAPPPPTPPVATPTPPTPAPPPTVPAAPSLDDRRSKAGALGLELTQKSVPYKADSSDPAQGGLDFVGYVQHVVKQAGVDLPRNPGKIVAAGARITSSDSLQAGDVLVFSKEEGSKKPNFLGVYLGDGQFGCSYPGKGVIAVALNHKFWKPRFLYGVRVIQ